VLISSVESEQVIAQAKKAAVILLALGGSLSSNLIKGFEINEIKRFASTAADLKEIDTNLLINLVDELSEEMNKPDPLLGGERQARTFLDDALPADRVSAVFGYDESHTLNIWKKFSAENESAIALYLLDEHPQTIAFIISNLEPELAPRIVSTLPRDIRKSVVLRLMKILPVKVACDQIVQTHLQKDLLSKVENHAELEGRSRIARLLNKMDKENIDTILDGLRDSSPSEAAAIRKMLFSFEDIVRLNQKDRLIMFDKVQTEQVMLALRGTLPDLREAVLSALGARARRMVEAELADTPSEITKEVVAARQAISEMALKLGGEGIIDLSDPKDDVESVAKAEDIA
jgi:flagellar motor switch protein FliG